MLATDKKELTVELLYECHAKMVNEIKERMRKIILIRLLLAKRHVENESERASLFDLGWDCLDNTGTGDDIREQILHELLDEKIIDISDDYHWVQLVRRANDEPDDEYFALDRNYPKFKEIMMLNDRHLPEKFQEMLHEYPTAELMDVDAAMKELADAIFQ